MSVLSKQGAFSYPIAEIGGRMLRLNRSSEWSVRNGVPAMQRY